MLGINIRIDYSALVYLLNFSSLYSEFYVGLELLENGIGSSALLLMLILWQLAIDI